MTKNLHKEKKVTTRSPHGENNVHPVHRREKCSIDFPGGGGGERPLMPSPLRAPMVGSIMILLARGINDSMVDQHDFKGIHNFMYR